MARFNQIKINEAIRSKEIRVIDAKGKNIGVVDTKKALEMAKKANLDLIEISPNAKPPIAKITDYGKFKYNEKKKLKVAKAKAHITETKVIQIKIKPTNRI